MKNLIQKARNLFAKAVGQPTVAPEKKPFQRQAESLPRYIYLNPGLNRHERRSLEAKIKRKKYTLAPHGSVVRLDPRGTPAEVKHAKWSLKNTPANIPATFKRLLDNSLRRLNGQDIKVWSR